MQQTESRGEGITDLSCLVHKCCRLSTRAISDSGCIFELLLCWYWNWRQRAAHFISYVFESVPLQLKKVETLIYQKRRRRRKEKGKVNLNSETNLTDGGVDNAVAADCSLNFSSFSISFLLTSLCRSKPTSSFICSFISLISISFSHSWHLLIVRTIFYLMQIMILYRQQKLKFWNMKNIILSKLPFCIP